MGLALAPSLRALPASIAAHSTLQTLYFDGDGLLKRHDHNIEIAGNTPAPTLSSSRTVTSTGRAG